MYKNKLIELLLNDPNDEFKQFLQCEADAFVVKKTCGLNLNQIIKNAEDKKKNKEIKDNFEKVKNAEEIYEISEITPYKEENRQKGIKNKGKNELIEISANIGSKSKKVLQISPKKKEKYISSVDKKIKNEEGNQLQIEMKKETKKLEKNKEKTSTIITTITNIEEDKIINENEKNLVNKNYDILLERIILILKECK
uniref:Uncharacterized protein n=1 Tax=Meloidogyne incognita TaxID=6306 RepID=A0A914LHZ4_MELIC